MLRVVWCGKVYLLHVHGQLCLLLFDLMDYSPPGSAVHGILQARILEWVAFSSCMWDLPRSGVEPVSPALAGRFFTIEPPGKPWEQVLMRMFQMLQPQHCNSCLNSSGSVPTSESPHGLLLCQWWLPADCYTAHPLTSPGSYSDITSSRYYH